MVKFRKRGEGKIIYPDCFDTLERITALNVPKEAVRIGDAIFNNIEEVPRELRHLIEEIVQGDEASNGTEFDVSD